LNNKKKNKKKREKVNKCVIIIIFLVYHSQKKRVMLMLMNMKDKKKDMKTAMFDLRTSIFRILLSSKSHVIKQMCLLLTALLLIVFTIYTAALFLMSEEEFVRFAFKLFIVAVSLWAGICVLVIVFNIAPYNVPQQPIDPIVDESQA